MPSIKTNDLPSLSTYDRALDYWETRKPWRNDVDTSKRPLAGNRAKHHLTIRKLGCGSIALRLYSTDVVVHHPDRTFTVEGYPSVSTSSFMWLNTPQGIRSFCTHSLGTLVGVSDMVVQANKPVRVRPHWAHGFEPADTTFTGAPQTLEPIEVARLDREAARVALKKHRYHEFSRWLAAYVSLSDNYVMHDHTYSQSAELVRLLDAGPESWPELAGTYKGRRLATDVLRDAIYQVESCVVREQHDTLPLQALDSYGRSQSRWAYL